MGASRHPLDLSNREPYSSDQAARPESAVLVAVLCIVGRWPSSSSAANIATNDWKVAPPNREMLRAQWEYARAVNALLIFVAFCSVALSAFLGRE